MFFDQLLQSQKPHSKLIKKVLRLYHIYNKYSMVVKKHPNQTERILKHE